MQPTLDCLEQLDRDQRLHDLEGAFRVDELADPDAVMQDGWTVDCVQAVPSARR